MTAERLLLLLLIAGLGIGCVAVLYPFLSAVLWAGILVFTTWPVLVWLRTRLRMRPALAAALLIAAAAVVIVLPLALVAPASAADVERLRALFGRLFAAGLPQAPDWVFAVPAIGGMAGDLWNRWAADISALAESLRPYFGMLAEAGLTILLGIAAGILRFVLALFVAFFFYVHGDALALRLRAVLARIVGPGADALIHLVGATVRGTVYGILGTAVIQGMLTALGLWLAGVPEPALLGLVAGLIAVLPIGAPAVWIPASIWLMGTGHLTRGILLDVYGVAAISGADALIRPLFVSRGAQLPFPLVVLGVLGGAIAFGLLGIFVGPVLLGVGYTLINAFARGEEGGGHGRA